MKLLRDWRDSLTIFVPSNFKLFMLVTLNALLKAYKDIATYFWWLVLAVVAAVWFNNPGVRSVASLVYSLVLFAILRPSIDLKNCAYYRRYSVYLGKFLLGYFPITTGIIGLVLALCMALFSAPVCFAHMHWIMITRIVMLFWGFFFLDSDKSFKAIIQSLVQACVMTWHNLPFVLIVGVAHVLVFNWLYSFGLMAHTISSLLLEPFFVAFVVNFYIKKIHEQFDLYFA